MFQADIQNMAEIISTPDFERAASQARLGTTERDKLIVLLAEAPDSGELMVLVESLRGSDRGFGACRYGRFDVGGRLEMWVGFLGLDCRIEILRNGPALRKDAPLRKPSPNSNSTNLRAHPVMFR